METNIYELLKKVVNFFFLMYKKYNWLIQTERRY